MKYDASVYAYLEAYARIPLSADNEPFRDLTQAEMAEYGVTADTCSAKCTISFYDSEDNVKSHTLYVGYKTFSQETTYYASLEGRNSVYRLQTDADKMFLSLVDYVKPLVYGRFSSPNEALFGIKRFNIFTTDLVRDESAGNYGINNIVDIVRNEEKSSEISAVFDLFCRRGESGQSKRTLADSEYLLAIFETLYVNFEGESVICINPDETTRREYGLGEGQEQYIVSCVVDDSKDTTVSFLISKEIEGYHYVESTILDTSTPVLVKVPRETLAFLGEDEKTLLKFASTTSVLAGFYEYLVPNAEAEDAPGMKEITITVPNGEETFYISYDEVRDKVSVTTKNSGMVFETIDHEDSYKRNQFNNFYTFLVFYPMPARFNSSTSEELATILTEDNIVYQLKGVRNDGKLVRYTYYGLSSSYAVAEGQVGKLVDGVEVWEDSELVFDTTMEHIDKIVDAYTDLMAGKELKPDDNIY